MRRWLSPISFVLLTTLSVPLLGQDATSLLDRVVKVHQEMKAIRLKSKVMIEERVGKQTLKHTLSHFIVFRRPNFVRLRIQRGERPPVVIVSDGDHLFIQVDERKQVQRLPAPKTLSAILRRGQPTPLVDAVSCFLGEGWRDKVAEAKIVGEEKVGRRMTTKLHLTLKIKGTQTLWISKEGLIWKSRFHRKAKDPRHGTIALTIMETFTDVTSDPKLPKDFFAYTPPKGFQVIEPQGPRPSRP